MDFLFKDCLLYNKKWYNIVFLTWPLTHNTTHILLVLIVSYQFVFIFYDQSKDKTLHKWMGSWTSIDKVNQSLRSKGQVNMSTWWCSVNLLVYNKNKNWAHFGFITYLSSILWKSSIGESRCLPMHFLILTSLIRKFPRRNMRQIKIIFIRTSTAVTSATCIFLILFSFKY